MSHWCLVSPCAGGYSVLSSYSGVGACRKFPKCLSSKLNQPVESPSVEHALRGYIHVGRRSDCVGLGAAARGGPSCRILRGGLARGRARPRSLLLVCHTEHTGVNRKERGTYCGSRAVSLRSGCISRRCAAAGRGRGACLRRPSRACSRPKSCASLVPGSAAAAFGSPHQSPKP